MVISTGAPRCTSLGWFVVELPNRSGVPHLTQRLDMEYAGAVAIAIAIYYGIMRHHTRPSNHWSSRAPLTMRMPLRRIPPVQDRKLRLRPATPTPRPR